MKMDIWFWQQIVTPHMAGLATALAAVGHRVTYVAEQAMSTERAAQGWTSPATPGVTVRLIGSDADVQSLVECADVESIHLCQGVRANGRVSVAQDTLAARGLREWVVMETVDDPGLRGAVKRWEYARLFRNRLGDLEGVLAIGHRTAPWLAARGVPGEMVFPFAYFLPETPSENPLEADEERPFRFVFVGQLIECKRVSLLLEALAGTNAQGFELAIVGTGSEEPALRIQADGLLAGSCSIRWCGQLPMESARQEIARADCLVLPSRHDGWGAVVSEALIAGTLAICSDACGSAGVVRASTVGGVFPSGSVGALQTLLYAAMARGPVAPDERQRVAAWAQCLGAERGARYLEEILQHRSTGSPRPFPPWAKQ